MSPARVLSRRLLRLVEGARTVLRHGSPEVVEAVERGALPIEQAEAIARQPAAEQPAAVAEATAPKPTKPRQPKAPKPKPPKARPVTTFEGPNPPLPLGLPDLESASTASTDGNALAAWLARVDDAPEAIADEEAVAAAEALAAMLAPDRAARLLSATAIAAPAERATLVRGLRDLADAVEAQGR